MRRVPSLAVCLLLLALPVHAASPSATYRVTFDATWSAQTHPVSFPPDPHFSPLVGGTHAGAVVFWQPGGTATNGIERMAEVGAQADLAAEVDAAILAGTAELVLLGGGIGTSPGSVSLEFTITQAFPQLTLVSMLAPSPDWFVGVHGLVLFDGANWLPGITVPLSAYDAGTDSGASYTSPDADTNPQDPIAPAAGPLAGAPPVGSFTIERLDADPVTPVPAAPLRVMALFAMLLAAVLWMHRREPKPGLRAGR